MNRTGSYLKIADSEHKCVLCWNTISKPEVCFHFFTQKTGKRRICLQCINFIKNSELQHSLANL